MRNGQINSLSEIDMEHLSFEDIRWRYGVFHPTSTGAGRDKQYSAWIGVQTSLGEIEKGVWYQAAEALIQKAGEQKLLEALTDWESRHNYAKDSARTVRHKALQLHISRIFDNPRWVNFIPFNREYRPEVLEHASLVTVINECCGKPGEVTQEQIDGACTGTVACPHCGRWSSFSIVEPKQAEEQGMEMIPVKTRNSIRVPLVPAIFAREPKKLGAPQIATVSSVNPRGNRTISRTIFRIICHRLRLKYFQLRPRSAPNIKGKSGMINCSISNTHLKGSIS